MPSWEDREIGRKHEIARPEWQPSASQKRDAEKRRQPGARLIGRLPLPPAADKGGVEVDNQQISLSNLKKVLFPTDGITKRDLLDYAHNTSEFLIPHMLDKPYTLKRFPNGIDHEFFFQKEAGERMPEWVRTVRIPSKGQRAWVNFVLCNDCPTLLYVVNAACIDHNCWMSRAKTPDSPDFVLLDLDPGPKAPFAKVVGVAQQIRRVLEEYEIEAYPKTSGATGMHIFIPLAPGHTYAHSQSFAEIILRLAAQRAPELTTEVWWVSDRPTDRVFLDYRQNARGKTVPPPYSPRPHPGAPVSTPLFWREVREGLDPSQFTIRTVLKRLEKHGDIFAGALPWSGKGQRIAEILERISSRTGMQTAQASGERRAEKAATRQPAPRPSLRSKEPVADASVKGSKKAHGRRRPTSAA